MKPRILVVDDDESGRTLLSSKLEAEGYEVETAVNGREAIIKAGDTHPDLIMLDVMMPVMDGYETCRRLKSDEETRYIPVVMLTARSELEDKLMGLELGAEDYIVKPYSLVEVSARVRCLLRMRALQSRLRETEEMAALGAMVDGIAHEIRNPLTAIGGMARRLMEHETDPERKRHAETIIKSVERMERMMQRIDEYKGILSSRLSPGGIDDVIAGAVEEIMPVIDGKKITVKTELMPAPPLFSMDRTNLKIALFNILQNAVEAIENEGEITVRTFFAPAGDNTLLLEISDTGPGIDEEFLRKIFHPFQTSKMTGAGLGLTITYRIIQDHMGAIDVRSKKGEGTTFTIRFHLKPIATAPGQTVS
ncbi:MAG: response regulator [Deltaproteobacteria bacterium]|nr:response regulator [Deltaproteobacteria bacterium]